MATSKCLALMWKKRKLCVRGDIRSKSNSFHGAYYGLKMSIKLLT